MQAEALQFFRRRSRETRGSNYWPAEFVAELLQSRCLVYRRADNREVQPVRGADITVADFAHVQCQAEMDLRLARRAAVEIAFCDLFRCGASGSESGAASWR